VKTIPKEQAAEETEKYVRKADGSLYLKHKIRSTDTLRSIAIKYNKNPSVLKKLNHIFGRDDEIHLKDYLLIPCEADQLTAEPEDDIADGIAQREKVKRLIAQFNISPEEAAFYLGEAKGDFNTAKEQLTKDIEFEKSNPLIKKKILKKIKKLKKK